jgi:DNA modification methylase
VDYRLHDNGLVVWGDAFDSIVIQTVDAQFGDPKHDHASRFVLTICDPPYGEITKEKWDVAEYAKWFQHCVQASAKDATIALWGGVGKPGNRPFVEFASQVEKRFPGWEIADWITWSKKRAYGKSRNYLFTREECLIIRRGNPTFNIPLLETKRGYAGYNPKYPAKSEYLRRTNVWTDVTEIFQGKIHPTQKPDRLYEILIQTHSNVGDVVYDPCAGSGTTARAAIRLARNFCIVEKKRYYLEVAGFMPIRKQA